jgi:DNA repair exonuclease SbcCD ATPase subunit
MALVSTADARQSELLQLQREYRNMELTRRAYAEESQALLRKQQSTLEKLRKDNDDLKNDIAMLMRGSNKAAGSAASQMESIQSLQDQGDKYANAIDFERRNIETMEEQIHIMRQKASHQRKAMGGVNASKENFFMIQKQIRILENRVEKALIRFNEAIAHNKTLRDEIDDLRRERVVFENVYRKMERDLQDKKRQMAEIIELSNQSYEQRDTFQMEIAAIEQSNRKEQEEFQEQMVELGRMLDNELRLPVPGANRPASRDVRSSGMNASGSLGQSGKLDGSEKTGKHGDRTDVLASMERIQNFEEAFNKIRAATGISDIEELVKNFIKNEDHNFSLFNYVNEQNNEIEKLEEHISYLREEERKYAAESGEDVQQHKLILRELESKLKTSEAMVEKYEVRAQDLQRSIESLKRGIQSIYEKLGIDEGDGLGQPMVTELNMVHYIGLIERKANDVLQRYADARQSLLSSSMPTSKFNEKEGETLSPVKSLVAVLGSGPKVPMGQELLHVNPPKLEEYQSDEGEDEDDDDAKPLTRDELKLRTLARMQRKGGTKGKGGQQNRKATLLGKSGK